MDRLSLAILEIAIVDWRGEVRLAQRPRPVQDHQLDGRFMVISRLREISLGRWRT
jgi:hypothetical protein